MAHSEAATGRITQVTGAVVDVARAGGRRAAYFADAAAGRVGPSEPDALLLARLGGTYEGGDDAAEAAATAASTARQPPARSSRGCVRWDSALRQMLQFISVMRWWRSLRPVLQSWGRPGGHCLNALGASETGVIAQQVLPLTPVEGIAVRVRDGHHGCVATWPTPMVAIG